MHERTTGGYKERTDALTSRLCRTAEAIWKISWESCCDNYEAETKDLIITIWKKDPEN